MSFTVDSGPSEIDSFGLMCERLALVSEELFARVGNRRVRYSPQYLNLALRDENQVLRPLTSENYCLKAPRKNSYDDE